MIDRVKNCVGCSGCKSICPKSAITMSADENGFLYPVIDAQLCINCDICESICPALNPIEECDTVSAVAAVHQNDDIRDKSSSGGVFYALAKSVIEDGGVVFGAAFDDRWRVKHIACDDVEQLDDLLRSKYVQSDVTGAFEKVKSLLVEGRTVIFCGTPCQCNAMSLYAGKDYDNLCLIDFICHGVPSPAVWKKYLKSISKNKTIDNINFRNKDTGWQTYSFTVDYCDASHLQEKYFENDYMKLFLSDLILRSSCYDCPAKYPHKKSDITLGDLWGADSLLPSHDNKGISFVTVNTMKGQQLIDAIKNELMLYSVDVEAAFQHNPSARRSVTCPDGRTKCLNDLVNSELSQFHKITTKYTSNSLMRKVSRVTKRTVKKFIKK